MLQFCPQHVHAADHRSHYQGRRIDLLLAAGGPIGGAWEIGALQAFEDVAGLDLSACRRVVGVSIGALVGMGLAAGLRPRELHRRLLVDKQARGLHRVLRFSILRMARQTVQNFWHVGLSKSFFPRALGGLRLTCLPADMLDGDELENEIQSLTTEFVGSDRFADLKMQFIAMATSLETGDGIPLGTGDWVDIPVARAIRASAAAPGLYAPVRIGASMLIDGALARTSYAAAAFAEPPDLLICINPIVCSGRGAMKPDSNHMGDVLDRSVRHLLHARFRAEIQDIRKHFPNTELLLLEPTDDCAPLDCGLFDLHRCLEAAELGYRSASKTLLSALAGAAVTRPDAVRGMEPRVGEIFST